MEDLARYLEFLKDKKGDEEFFLIWSGCWCAGYMKTPGSIPTMDVSTEVIGETIEEALTNLCKEMKLEFPP
ncbi:MAG: hypothetical protein WC374_04295 [Phycisphaerae bacterium]